MKGYKVDGYIILNGFNQPLITDDGQLEVYYRIKDAEARTRKTRKVDKKRGVQRQIVPVRFLFKELYE